MYRQVLAVEPTNADALCSLGTIAHQAGNQDSAIELIDKALAIKPDLAAAWLVRSNALQALTRYEEALASCDKALSINHEFVEALCNRGNALQALTRDEEALASYDKALATAPNFAEALSNRGNVLRKLGRYEEALGSYDKALAINPGFAQAFNNRGTVLQSLKRYEEALACYDRALAINPEWALPHLNRARTLLALQRPEDGIGAYRKALERGANAEQISYELAAFGVGSIPTAAPVAYVIELFDNYADTFDRHLVSALKYQTPNLLFNQLARFCRSRDLDVLDLGCGTGLLAPLLRPLARTLTGVDLSANMLQRAAHRRVYDHLVQSELTEFLNTKKDSFDLAVAADVFVYVGDLTGVFARLREALRTGGWFSFSVEANDGEAFALTLSGRYRHSATYCKKLAADHGFAIADIEPRAIRQENGADVNGYLFLMQRR